MFQHISVRSSIIYTVFAVICFGKLLAQPTITSFSPLASPSGSLVTITGTNFNSTLANNEVFFGGVKANVVSVTSTTQLVAVVPVAASGESFITVRNTATRLQGRSLRRFAHTFSGGSTTTSTQFPTASKSTVLAPSQSTNPIGGDVRINSLMISVGDFNADGFLDYASWGESGTDVRIYINNGASGAISASKFSTTYTYSIPGIQGIHDRPVDMNGDGMLDIVCFSSSGISVLVNNLTNATPSFTKTDVAIASGFYRVAVDDFNNDGRLDIAGTTGRYTKNIRILQNTSSNGTLSFSGTLTTITTAKNAVDVHSGDFDNDGDIDLLYTNYDAYWNVTAFELRYIKNNTPSALTFGNETQLFCCLNEGEYSEFPIVNSDDLDGDGDLDIVTLASANSSATNNVLMLFKNNGSWSFSSTAFSQYQPSSNFPEDLEFGDMNGDGKMDIVVSTDVLTADLVVFYNQYVSGNFDSQSFGNGSKFPINVNTDAAYTLGLGDMNADGKIDLISNTLYNNNMITWASGSVSSATATVSTNSLSGFSSCSNGLSTAQTFTVSATGLGTDNLVVTAPTGFEVSKNASTGYASSISFAPTGGSVSSSTVYVRQNQATVGMTSGAVFITANTSGLKSVLVSGSVISAPTVSGSTSVIKNNSITLTGSGTPNASTPWASSNTAIATVNPSGTTATVIGVSGGTTTITYTASTGCSATSTITVLDPTISVNSTTLSGMGRCATSSSLVDYATLIVNGTSLAGDITATVSSNFELSYSPNPVIAQFSSIVLTQSSGTVSNAYIYVRLKSGISGAATGNITLTTPNGTSVVVSLAGTGFAGTPVLSTSNATRCGSGTVTLSGSVSNGGTINWYSASSGGSLLASGTSYTTSNITGALNGQVFTVYPSATNTCGTTARNTVTATVYNTPAPTASAQTFCSGATVANLVATGTNVKWYDAGSGGSSLTTSTQLVSGTYYATSTSSANCESTSRTAVVVTINAALPVLTANNNSRCGSGSLVLSATATNMSAHQIRWYTVSTSGTALSTGVSNLTIGSSTYTLSFASNEVGTSKTYYVEAQNACGTTTRSTIIAYSNSAVPVVSTTTENRCGAGDVTLSASATNMSGHSIRWYTVPTGGTAISAGIATPSLGSSSLTATFGANELGTSKTFYVEAQNACGTTARSSVVSQCDAALPVVTLTPSDRCGAGVVTLSAAATDMSAHNIRWYTVASGGSPITSGVTTPAVGSSSLTATFAANEVGTSKTFYVEAENACGTTNRSSVVSVCDAALPLLTLTDDGRCGSGNVVLSASATNMSAHNIRWYTVSTNGTAISSGISNPSLGSSELTASFASNEVGTSKTYFVEAQNVCGTTNRGTIVATSFTIPGDPTTTDASRCGNGTLTLLSTTENDMEVRWYTASGSIVLHTGSSFTTPSLTETTVYRAQLWNIAGSAAGFACNSALVDATAVVNTTATWSGTGTWSDDSKWNCGSGTYPTGNENIVISSGTVSLTEDVVLSSNKTLTVNATATVIVEPSYAMTINSGGSVVNDGTIVVNADATDYGQLVLSGTYSPMSSGVVTVKRLYNVSNAPINSKWIQFSSPVVADVTQLGNVQPNNLFSWDPTVNNWNSVGSSGQFDPSKGYTTYFGSNGVSSQQSGTVTLSGAPVTTASLPSLAYSTTINPGVHFASTEKRGWNLIGNPLTCNLDFSTLNKSNNVENAFYRWDPNKGGAGQPGYHAHAAASVDFNDVTVPPMAAFWIRTTNNSSPNLGNGTISHGNNGRRNNNKPFKTAPDKILVTVSDLSSPSISDNLSIAMIPGSSDEFEGQWDAWELLNGGQMPNIYANFSSEWTTAKAVDFSDQALMVKVVPVGVKSPVELRPYRIHLDQSRAQPLYTIYLRDLYFNQVHNLSTSDYVFAYTSAMEDRFELILTNAKTGALGLEEASRGALTAWVSGSELWITGLESGAQELDVVGMDGRVVLSAQLRAEAGQPVTTSLPELPAGLYTVRVRANGMERGVRFAVFR